MKYIIKRQEIVKEEIEIVHCPFCKSTNLDVVYNQGSYGYSSSESYVQCNDCKARGPVIKSDSLPKDRMEINSILQWNKSGV